MIRESFWRIFESRHLCFALTQPSPHQPRKLELLHWRVRRNRKHRRNCVSNQRLTTRMHARMHVCWCSQVFARNAKVKNLNSSQLQNVPLIFLSDKLSSPHCTNATAGKWKVLVHTWSQCSSWRARVLWKLTKIDALKSWIWYLSYEHMPLSQTTCWLHLVPPS